MMGKYSSFCFSFSILSYSEKLLTTFCTSNLPFCIFIFREKGMGKYRQGACSTLSVSVGTKKVINSIGLLVCEPFGNRLFGKVNDGLQRLTAYNIQQLNRFLKCGFEDGDGIISLREIKLIGLLSFWDFFNSLL